CRHARVSILDSLRVYYVEGLNHNLFSVGQFCDADFEVAFRKSTCFVRELQGNDLLIDAHVPSQQELNLLFGPLYDEFFNAGSNPQDKQPIMNIQSTSAPSTPTYVHAKENTNNQVEEEHSPDEEFTNPLCVPAQEVTESSSHNIEQVRGNPSRPVQTRRQLATDPEMCMFALTVSTAESKNIKEVMADSAWIEAMQEELHQFDRLQGRLGHLTDVKTAFLNGSLKEKGANEELLDGGSSRVIVYGYDGLHMLPDEDEHEPMFMQPHDPDFVPEPIYLEYIPLEDEHILSAEEKPLPLVVSPTAESPVYVAESGPEEDPEEYEDDETEDGPVNYPMDGGDDGDDDNGDSSGDDADDEDEDEEEEEEHLAPTDFSVVIPTDELVAISFPPEAEANRRPRIDYGFVSTLDAEARRRGIGEVGYGIRDTWVDPAETVPKIAPMTMGEVNTRVTELAELYELDTHDLYALLEDAQDSRTRIS
nr:integrase, catalytic region, zinc finger, CCHC-type, peptidase aspartic, catalytic [Tanacetum cinerariifolium]